MKSNLRKELPMESNLRKELPMESNLRKELPMKSNLHAKRTKSTSITNMLRLTDSEEERTGKYKHTRFILSLHKIFIL
jgi:hypothetical protein